MDDDGTKYMSSCATPIVGIMSAMIVMMMNCFILICDKLPRAKIQKKYSIAIGKSLKSVGFPLFLLLLWSIMEYLEIRINIVCSGMDDSLSLDDVRAVVMDAAGEVGFESFVEDEHGIVGYCQQTLFDEESLHTALEAVPLQGVRFSWSIAEAPYRDWNEEWERLGFEPIIIADEEGAPRCVIHDGVHIPEVEDGVTAVVIEPRQAFGTGTHETTRMVLSTLLIADVRRATILDCGCGTGILAIAALKCGAASAVGYDIDEWSVANAQHNAALNGVTDCLEIRHGDSAVVAGDGTYDFVLANINRNILVADMPTFAQRLAVSGTLIVSGFFVEDNSIITAAAAAQGLTLSSTTSSGDWACLAFRHL